MPIIPLAEILRSAPPASPADFCAAIAEALAGVPVTETLEEIRAICPSLSTDFLLAVFFGFAP